MASVLQVATIKDSGGNANAIEIANSSANVTVNNLAAGTIGSAVTFPAGHIIKAPVTEFLGASVSRTNDSGTSDVLSASISVDSTSDKIFIIAHISVQLWGANSVLNPTGTLILRDHTGSADLVKSSLSIDNLQANSHSLQFPPCILTHLASPGATGTYTYKLQLNTGTLGRTYIRGNNDGGWDKPTQLHLFYIKG
tara:strand:- start:188 stop:775 length:588 start_codon:yes stop_codon:yes gene_type:complete